MAMTVRQIEREDRVLRYWLAEVSLAASALERRWTTMALKRVDADVAQRLREQRGLFDEVCISGSADEIEGHGAAMCRGYAAAIRALEAAGEPDDAYLLGQDPRSGFRVAIGHQKAAAERVGEVCGAQTVWVTPDEVAAVLAGLEGFKALAAIKRIFPGAEIVDVHPGEPAKAESGLVA